NEIRDCLQPISEVQPTKPPPVATLLFSLSPPTNFVINENWALSGASASNEGVRVRISTPADPWHYAATLPFSVQGLDLERTWAWVKIRVHRTKGCPLVALFDESGNDIIRERGVQPEDQDLYFDVLSNAQDRVLIRNGAIPQISEIEIDWI